MLLRLSEYKGINPDHIVAWKSTGQLTDNPVVCLYMDRETGLDEIPGVDIGELETRHIILEENEREVFLSFVEEEWCKNLE